MTHFHDNPKTSQKSLVALMGPAFVAAVAYVDPGNVAANITAGARYGYTLVWVLVLANLMAMLVQYESAKFGIVTGRSLPQVLGDRLRRPGRIAFWIQAEIVAGATDLAEVIGGAIALNLLFGTPLLVGGLIIGVVSLGMLFLQNTSGQIVFERVIIALLLVITLGFVGGLVVAPPLAGCRSGTATDIPQCRISIGSCLDAGSHGDAPRDLSAFLIDQRSSRLRASG